MKRLLFIPLLALVSFMAQAQSKYDLNGDGDVNIGDVTKLVNVILGKDADDTPPTETDVAVEVGLCPDAHHPHLIDMGAAGKWACCNVGASNPFEYGGYYAWGDTEEKSFYGYTNYKYWHDMNGDGKCDTNEFGYLGDICGNPQYDVAKAKWGGAWKMPTLGRIQALLNCSSESTTIDCVNGRLFTASNGNRLFLPAAGIRGYDDLSGTDDLIWAWAGSCGYYWSSAPDPSISSQAYYLFFDRDGRLYITCNRRYEGFSVRPVAE